jgi:hypothetical protein
MKNIFTVINWKYTLGEIFIVIIGITIAFNLNRWGENARGKETEEAYLESLFKDVESDKKELESNLVRLQKNLNQLQYILPRLGKTEEKKQYVKNGL